MKQYHKYEVKQTENNKSVTLWLSDDEATSQRTQYGRFVQNKTVALDVTLIINNILNEYEHLHETQNICAANAFVAELKTELKNIFTAFND